MKKKKIPVLPTVLLVLLAFFIGSNIWLHVRMMEMGNRMSYLQDTSSVIQTDLGSLQSDIEKTLREENSFLESYSIDVVDTDFAAGTYQLSVSAIPKEYTDSTRMSIYFGTAEYPLEKDGFHYVGAVELPLDESYKGNVTMLITNGKKKNTEVLSSYIGFQEQFDNVLAGSMDELPSCRNGRLVVRTDIEFSLEGQDTYGVSGFASLQLIVQAGDAMLCCEELITEKTIQENDQSVVPAERGREELRDTELESFGTVAKTVSGLYGNHHLNLRENVEGGTEVEIFLKAVSTDGYTFVYELFSGATNADGDGFVEQENYVTGDYSVYDRKGGRYEPVVSK